MAWPKSPICKGENLARTLLLSSVLVLSTDSPLLETDTNLQYNPFVVGYEDDSSPVLESFAVP
jgi:hypothetical protein